MTRQQLVLVALVGAVIGAVVAVVLALLLTQPVGVEVPPGASVTDAIAATADGGTVVLLPGDHGTKDLANVAGRGITVRCEPDARPRRWRLSNVTDLRITGCTMDVSASDVGVWIGDGGHDLTIDGLWLRGGERGVLVQNDLQNKGSWSQRVVIANNRVELPVSNDALAVYGGRDLRVERNVVVMDTDGCDQPHEDGFQSRAVDGLDLVGNVFLNNANQTPSMTCPDGSYPHDQGVIFTQGEPGDEATNVHALDNRIVGWFSGLPFLIDGARTNDVVIERTTIVCAARETPKVTGDPSEVTVTGSAYVPCPTVDGREGKLP